MANERDEYEGPGGGRYLSFGPDDQDEAPDLADPEDPTNWGPGPWANEPDRLEFRFLGYPCLILRGPNGNLCGYVGVGPNSPWYQRDYNDVSVRVHGGLTYSDLCFDRICHVPKGEDRFRNPWWLGFDCGHAGDLVPSMLVMLRRVRRFMPSGFLGGLGRLETYRDLAYVVREVKRLAVQAKRAETLRGRIEEHFAGVRSWWDFVKMFGFRRIITTRIQRLFDHHEYELPACLSEESLWKVSLWRRRKEIGQ